MAKRLYVSFAEVKEKIPIPEVLEVLGVTQQFQRKGETFTGVCPLPSHRHGPSPNPEQFKIDHKKGLWLWKCFGDCKRGGDVIEFVKAMTGYDNAHVRYWFAEHFPDRLGLRKPKENGEAGAEKAHEDAPVKERSSQAATSELSASGSSVVASATISPTRQPLKPLRFHLQLDPFLPYLQQRGLLPETVLKYGLGLCRKGTLAGYVAIPVHDWPREPGVNPVGYIGRFPGDDYESHGKTRYLVPTGFETSRIVYGWPQALAASTDGAPLILVEGAFKVFHLVQAGFPTAVSTLTASLSDEQAGILAATGRPVVLFFDGNEAGYAGMQAAAGRLITRAYVRAIKLAQDVEPDHLPADQLRELLAFV